MRFFLGEGSLLWHVPQDFSSSDFFYLLDPACLVSGVFLSVAHILAAPVQEREMLFSLAALPLLQWGWVCRHPPPFALIWEMAHLGGSRWADLAEHASLLSGKQFSPHPRFTPLLPPPTPSSHTYPLWSSQMQAGASVSHSALSAGKVWSYHFSKRSSWGAGLFLHSDPYFYKKVNTEAWRAKIYSSCEW